jgi:hypothetical protein
MSQIARAGLALACVAGLLTAAWWISRRLEAGLHDERPAFDDRRGG